MEPADAGSSSETAPAAAAWDAQRIRRLRALLADSQSAFADRLGTRQQTVSEWERGTSRPRRMAQRLLHMLAEEAGVYRTDRERAAAQGDAGPEHGQGGPDLGGRPYPERQDPAAGAPPAEAVDGDGDGP